MIQNIELTKSSLARLTNRGPLLLPGDLTLLFEHSGYNMLNAFIELKNGVIQDNYRFEKTFTVPDKFLFAGALEIQVNLYLDGELIKTWKVLPIKIKELEDGKFEIADLLANTVSKKEFDELKASVEKLISQHKVTL